MKIRNSFMKPEQCEMHNCLRILTRLCRWFGYFPVEGLDNSSIDQLRFNLRSFYSIYLFLSILGLMVICVITLHGFLTNPFSLSILQYFLLNYCALVSSLLLLKLAKHWPSILRTAAEIEKRITAIRITKNTAIKTNVTVYVIVIMAMVDHILFYVYMFRVVLNCMAESYITAKVFKNFTIIGTSYLFEYTSYNIGTAMFLMIMNLKSVFLWSATDMMVMCVGIYLSSYFRDQNTIIYSPKPKSVKDWARLRLHYSHIVELVNQIDPHLRYFVILSFSTNLFFLCVQLFNTLNPLKIEIPGCDIEGLQSAFQSTERVVYYSFSFVFLVTRATTLLLLAAQVQHESKKPAAALAEIPASVYNIEIQRFHRQIHYTTTGLNGSFFFVTRSMILKVIGQIITYELVLLQFRHGGKPADLYLNNSTVLDIK